MVNRNHVENTDFPILCLAGKHHRVLILGDIIILLNLSLLGAVLSLDALVLGESAVVTRLNNC